MPNILRTRLKPLGARHLGRLEQQDIARRSIRGSLLLFGGNFGSNALLAVTSILIARLLGPSNYGAYNLVLVIPGFLSSFVGFGVNSALTRYAAYGLSKGEDDEARHFTVNSIRFLWLTGVGFTILEFILAVPFSNLFIHRPELAPYVQLVSVAVMGATFLSTIVSVAIGWNRYGLSAASSLTSGVVKLAFAPALIVAGFGLTGALVGHVVSLIAAGIIGTAVLYFTSLRGLGGADRFFADVRELLGFGLPLYAGSLLASLATFFATFILAFVASNTVFGYYQAAANFTAPITMVSSALTSALFPAFASFDGVGGEIRVAFSAAYRFVAFLICPVIIFMLASASQLVHVLYGFQYNASVPFLQLLTVAYLPVAFGYTVHPSFFSGFGRPKLTMLLQVGGALTLAAAAPLLSLTFGLGVDGVIYATLLSLLVAWGIGTVLADKFMQARLDMKANGAILLSSLVAYAATILLPNIPLSNVLTLATNLVLFSFVYLTLAPLSRAIKSSDLRIMEHSLSGMGVLSKAFGLLLRYQRFLLSVSRAEVGSEPAAG